MPAERIWEAWKLRALHRGFSGLHQPLPDMGKRSLMKTEWRIIIGVLAKRRGFPMPVKLLMALREKLRFFYGSKFRTH